jgi:RNA polymerase sigma-70 factor (ECF subfamily)
LAGVVADTRSSVGTEDPSGFAVLAQEHRPALARYCRHLAGNASDGEDLLQETLVKAFTGFGSLTDPARFGPWCRSIARNTYVSGLRRRRFAEEDLNADPVDDRDPMDDAADQLAYFDALTMALRDLTERDRRVVIGRAEGATAKDLSSELHVAPALVDTIYARSKAKLRVLILEARGALLGLGVLVPPGLRNWGRRKAAAVGDAGRTADGLGGVQLVALLATAVMTGVVASQLAAHTTSGHQIVAAPASLSTSATRGAVARARGASVVVDRLAGRSTGASTSFVAANGNPPPYQPHHCLFIADCGSSAKPHPGMRTITVGVGSHELWQISYDPNLLYQSNLPRTPQDFQTIILGDPNGIRCDSAVVTTGRTCGGEGAVTLAHDLAEFWRVSVVGDYCKSYAEMGINIPVVCQPVPPLPANAAKPRLVAHT